MIFEKFDAFPTEQLKQRFRLNTIALLAVGVGSSFAMITAIYRLVETQGATGTTTLIFSGLAIIASIPTYFERRRIAKILVSRLEYVKRRPQ